MPIINGKPIHGISAAAGKPVRKDILNNTATISLPDMQLILSKFNTLTRLGIDVHKVLSWAIYEFTKKNHIGNGKDRKLTIDGTLVQFPLKVFLQHCGCDINNEDAVKNGRRKITKALNILYNASASWKENRKGNAEDFDDIRYISRKRIRSGYVIIRFTPEFAKCLMCLPITMLSPALFKIDGYNINAYKIGLKMVEHASIDNNRIKGTAHILKVSTLLKETNLPPITEIRAKHQSWNWKIKEPFEKALQELNDCGLLTLPDGWYYCHSKGVRLTDAEADFDSYEEWTECFIQFDLKDEPDQTERLAKREAEKKEAAKKKRKRIS